MCKDIILFIQVLDVQELYLIPPTRDKESNDRQKSKCVQMRGSET